MKNKNLYLTVLGVRKSKIKKLADPLASGGPTFWFIDGCHLTLPSHGREREGVMGSSSPDKGTSSVMGEPPS